MPTAKQEKNRTGFRQYWNALPSYQRKLLGCFLLVSFVLFFAFALLVLRAADTRYRSELHNMGEQTITQARNTCDTLLLEVFRHGLTSVTNDAEVVQQMYKPSFDTGDALVAQELLADMQRYNEYVDNIYIINFANGGVLTKNGRVQISTFYDPELIELVEALPVSSVPVRYMPRVATVRSSNGHIAEEKVWTVIFHSSHQGAFVMNVSYDRFIQLLNIRSDSSYLHNYIINGDGQLLAGPNEEQFGADLSQTALYQAVREQPTKQGNFAFTDPDTQMPYTVYYIRNAYLGLTYISTVQNTLFWAGNDLFLSLLGLSVLFLLLSAAGSFLLAGRAYQPVKHLSAALIPNAPAGGDEFDQIRTAYAAMQEEKNTLQTSAEGWRLAQEKRMLLKWLDPGAISTHYKPEQYEALEANFPHLLYCCVLFRLDPTPGITDDGKELALLKYSITNMMEELAEGEFLMRSLDYTPDQVIILCNFEAPERESMTRLLSTVQTVLAEHFHVTATVAVSVPVADTDALPACLQSAKQAVAKRFLNGPGHLIFCEDATNAAVQSAGYPQDIVNELVQAARAGDAGGVTRQLNAFAAAIRSCPMETIVLYLLQLDSVCQKLEESNHLDQQPLELGAIYSDGLTLDDILQTISARLQAVVAVVLSLRESNAEKLVARVNKLVEENLRDPNLSVAWLADEVDLSINYLRNVYKEATGESLSGYITAAKVGLICQMLQTSDLSIQEISEQLGFTTRNYFFTFFKKHMGVTPKQYRLMQGNLQD